MDNWVYWRGLMPWKSGGKGVKTFTAKGGQHAAPTKYGGPGTGARLPLPEKPLGVARSSPHPTGVPSTGGPNSS